MKNPIVENCWRLIELAYARAGADGSPDLEVLDDLYDYLKEARIAR